MPYKFIKTPDPHNKYSIASIEISIDDDEITLDSLVEVFEEFVIACGFSRDSKLELVEKVTDEDS